LWLSRSALALGMLSISISKAGLGVLQHACLAQALPCARGAHSGHGTSSLISGICVTIATTHVVGAATNATVPRIIERYGIVGLQLALLLPSAVGVLSGIALGLWLPQPQPPTPPESPEVSRRGTGSAPFEVNCTTCGRRIRLPTPWKTTCDKCRLIAAISRRQRAAVLALGLWRALLVGSLHALKMITLALLVAHGITAENAGGLLALTNTVSLLLLPLLPLLSSRGNGLVHALLLLSLATLACMIGLVLSEELLGEDASWSARVHPLAPQGGRDHRLDDTYGDDDALPLDTRAALGGLRPINGLTLAWLLPRLSVFGFAVCGTLAPVVPLALVPQVNGVDASVGAAYGRLEMIFSGTQALIVLAVGAARQHGGFKLALRVLTTTMVLSIPITLLAMRLTTAAIVATRDKKGNLWALEEGPRSWSKDDLDVRGVHDVGRQHSGGTRHSARPTARLFRASYETV